MLTRTDGPVSFDVYEMIQRARAPYDVLLPHMPELRQDIVEQIARYAQSLLIGNERRGETKRVDVEREVALFFYQLAHWTFSRELRRLDLEDPAIKDLFVHKTKLFTLGVPILAICVDDRLNGKMIFGLGSNATRMPGGDVTDIVPNEDGQLFLPEESVFAQTIFRYVDKDNRNVVVVVLDSHKSCAAWGHQEETEEDEPLPDQGRLHDVIRKKRMGEAIKTAVAKKYGGRVRTVIVQTGFDPKSGYLLMGMEQVLEDQIVRTTGFTDAVVKRLVKEGRIISTKELVYGPDSRIRDEFQRRKVSINYEADYRQSTVRFLNNLIQMVEETDLVEMITNQLKRVFDAMSEDELRERAVLLLANAFNAYLHGHHALYPYDEHNASVVVGTHSDLGPYDRIHAITVNPDDPNAMAHFVFSYRLIRENRRKMSMSRVEQDIVYELYPDLKNFEIAPVPLIKFERLPEEQMCDRVVKDAQTVGRTDWTDLPTINWSELTAEEFMRYVNLKIPGISYPCARALENLRQRARRHYNPANPIAGLLIRGNVAPYWVLADPNRHAFGGIPFLKAGYSGKDIALYRAQK